MIWIAREWRFPKVIIGFFIAEFVFTIPALVLFALADPDEYRTLLWRDGFLNGFNSSPQTALYQAANYQPVTIPIVWSSFITSFNVVISVLSMFFLLVKGIMFIMKIWLPIISFLIHGGITAIWAYSTWAQLSSDMTDPKRPQPGAPWYITMDCSVAHFESNINNCKQAKACFAITVIMLSVFTANTAFAAFSMWPSKAEREQRRREREEEEADDEDGSDFDPDIGVSSLPAKGNGSSDEDSIEMERMHHGIYGSKSPVAATYAAAGANGNRKTTVSTMAVKSPVAPGYGYGYGGQSATATAMTPRTTAFHRLGGH